jgi:hypothetical protein
MAIKLLDNSSFALMRTNPKLTTNIKVVVDSNDGIFLESFDANTELAKSKYKAFKVSNKSTYDYDVSRFYRRGDTPSDIAFDVHRAFSDISVHDDFAEQYEFKYGYGATSINSKTYDEEFGILAPIWLERTIPDYFVVFRVDGPVSVNNLTVDTENENTVIAGDPNTFVDAILKNATLVKTFDLTEKSESGKYLRNYRESERFPTVPFIFSTEREQASIWNGIDINKGGFVSKNEFAYDRLFATDSTIIEDEHYLTSGFERNKVAIANIMNMQFLFDDPGAEDFTINRYFGLYVNAIDEGCFQANGESLFRMHQNRNEHQHPHPKTSTYITPNNTKVFEQSNENGIIIPILGDSVDANYITGDIDNDLIPDLFDKDFLPKSDDVESLVSIFYVKDKYGNFYNLKTGGEWTDGEEVRIQETKIDWQDFTGANEPLLTQRGYECRSDNGTASTFLVINSNIPHGDRYAAGIVRRQSYVFTADIILPGDAFTITDGTDVLVVNAINSNPDDVFDDIRLAWLSSGFVNFDKFNVSAKNGQLVIVEKKTSGVDINFTVSVSSTSSDFEVEKTVSADMQPFTITADQTLILEPGAALGAFFNPIGTQNEVARAMSSAFNNIKDRFYEAVAVKNTVILVAKVGGRRFNDLVIARDAFLNGNHVEILSNTDGFLHPSFTVAHFEGGSEDCESRIAVDISSFNTFAADDRYLQVVDQTGDSNTLVPVQKVSFYIDEPIRNREGVITGYKNFDKWCTVNVEDGQVIFKDIYKSIYLYELFKVPFGRFSIFPIKDMDVDFYSTEYGDEKELNIETEYYSGFGENTNINTHADVEDFYINKEFSTLQGVLETEGPDKDLDSPKIESEYERLKENFLKELTVPSRIVPYINKWVYRNGKNVREHDYRLSSSEAFGIGNFTPSKDELERDPDYFTHEWYYLQKIPPYFGYFTPSVLEKVFSYFPEEIDVTSTGLMNLDEDYFTEYFTVDLLKYPVLDTSDDAITSEINVAVKKQLRYSTFEGGNPTDFATAFHRGVKTIIKERVENQTKIDFNLQNIKLKKDNRFNNYKFSCVLVPHDGTYPENVPRRRVEIEFLENRKHKHVTLVIYAKINDLLTSIRRDVEGVIVLDDHGFFDRTILYTLNSQFSSISQIDLNTDGSMDYADVEISGAVDMRFTSGTNFGTGDVYGINDVNNDPTRWLDEIIINENGGYNKISATSGPVTREFQVLDVKADDYLIGTLFTGGPQPAALSDSQVENGIYIYQDGGFDYWKDRLNRLSYGAIAELINNGSPNITYKTILEDGSIVDDLFIVELQTPKPTLRPNYLQPIDDSNKPVSFNLSDTIGFELNYQDKGHVQPVYRHGGFYQPKFIDVVCFEDPYIIKEYDNPLERESQIRKNLRDANTQFTINEDFAKLKNVFYHKVNDTNASGVLELTNESAFKPLYPLIGEIAIDKTDIYMWKSNWDAGYFKRHIAKTVTEDVIGTRAVAENKAFFASKVMKILDEVLVETFDSIEASSNEELKVIGEQILQPGNPSELTWYDNGNQIIMDIYLEKRLTQILSNTNIQSFFAQYIRPDLGFGLQDSLEDDILAYIKLNILPRYTIGEVELYVNKSKAEDFNVVFPIINSTLTDIQKLDAGLVSGKDFNYNKLSSRSNFNVKLIYNKTSGFKYTIAPSFKIIKK